MAITTLHTDATDPRLAALLKNIKSLSSANASLAEIFAIVDAYKAGTSAASRRVVAREAIRAAWK